MLHLRLVVVPQVRVAHWLWELRAWRESTVAALERRAAEDPDNARWHEELGRIYEWRLDRTDGDLRRANGVLALKHYEGWRKRAEPQHDFSPLNRLPYLAYEFADPKSAHRHARDLADFAARNPEWGNANHHGWAVLGLLAMKAQDADEAERCLVASSATPGSPQLNSFGPSLRLAGELVAAGRTETVREYLHRCKRFWVCDDGMLRRCIADIDAGRTPDFGGAGVHW